MKFGTGDDLQIFHDGSNSHITVAGTGAVKIQGSSVEINGTGENMAVFTDDRRTLYHNGSAKIATTSAGVDVTGTVQGTASRWTTDQTIGQLPFLLTSCVLIMQALLRWS